MASLWTPAAISVLLPDTEEGEQDAAARAGEQVTSLVERTCHLTLIRRALPVIYRTADDDPVRLPEHWRPNPAITEVRGSSDRTAARADWPLLEYDFDGVDRVFPPAGGWPRQSPAHRARYIPRAGLYGGSDGLLPSVSVSGTAGALEAPLGANLSVPEAAQRFSDLFGAAEDLLRVIWAYRQAGPLISAEEIASGNDRLRWARNWPAHVRQVLEFYSHRGIDGDGA